MFGLEEEEESTTSLSTFSSVSQKQTPSSLPLPSSSSVDPSDGSLQAPLSSSSSSSHSRKRSVLINTPLVPLSPSISLASSLELFPPALPPVFQFDPSAPASLVAMRSSTRTSRMEQADTEEMDDQLDSIVTGNRRSTTSIRHVSSKHTKKRKHHTLPAVLRLTPEWERKMGEANIAFAAQDYEKAVHLLHQVAQACPGVISPYNTLLLIHESCGDDDKVLDILLILSKLQQREAHVWHQLAQVAHRVGKYDIALDAATKASRLDEEDLDSINIKATILFDRQEYVKASKDLELLYSRERSSSAHVHKLAHCYLANKCHERAITLLEDWFMEWKSKKEIEFDLNKCRDSTSESFSTSSVHFFLQEEHSEQEQIPRVADEDTQNMLCLSSLIALYIEQHHFTQALTLVNTITRLHCTAQDLPPSLQVDWCIALVHSGQEQRAALLLNYLWDSDIPDSPGLIFRAAESFFLAGHTQLALSFYGLVKDLEPFASQPSTWLREAACLKLLGNSDEELRHAMELYEKVLVADQGNAEARIGLVELRRELGIVETPSTSLENVESSLAEKKARNRATMLSRVKRPPLFDGAAELVFKYGFVQSQAQIEVLRDKCCSYPHDAYLKLLEICLPILHRTLDIASNANKPSTNQLVSLLLAKRIASEVDLIDEASMKVDDAKKADNDNEIGIGVSNNKVPRSVGLLASQQLLTVEGFQVIGACLTALYQGERYMEGIGLAFRVTNFIKLRSPYVKTSHLRRERATRLEIPAARLAHTAGQLDTAFLFIKQAIERCGDALDSDLEFIELALDVFSRVQRQQQHQKQWTSSRKWAKHQFYVHPRSLLSIILSSFAKLYVKHVKDVDRHHAILQYERAALTVRLRLQQHQCATLIDEKYVAAALRLSSTLCRHISFAYLGRAVARSHKMSPSRRARQPAELIKALRWWYAHEKYQKNLQFTFGTSLNELHRNRAAFLSLLGERHLALVQTDLAHLREEEEKNVLNRLNDVTRQSSLPQLQEQHQQ